MLPSLLLETHLVISSVEQLLTCSSSGRRFTLFYFHIRLVHDAEHANPGLAVLVPPVRSWWSWGLF